MIEHYFSRTSVITRLRCGLLGSARDDLATALHQQGSARESIRHSLHAGEQFGPWLAHHGYARQEVHEALSERYRRGLPRPPAGRQPNATEGWPHLRRLLQQRGMGATPPPVPSSTAVEHGRRRYEQSRDPILGVTLTTRKPALPIATRFLDACCPAGHVDWSALRAQELTDLMRQAAAPSTGGGRQGLTAAVRGCRRFLGFGAALRPGWEAAVPTLRQWTPAPLPQRLTAVQGEQSGATCTGSVPQPLRNRAILLFLARLGGRAHDVLTLPLEDIDWR
jgi:hypothetical protein